MLSGVFACRCMFPFQSTPLVSERRCVEENIDGRGNILFQSTPLVSERRCWNDQHLADRLKPVSIHAPRFREAMPTAATTS